MSARHGVVPPRPSLLGDFLERLIFGRRGVVSLLFLVASGLLLPQAAGLRLDSGFDRSLATKHPLMAIDRQHRDHLGGAHPVRVVLSRVDGDVYDAAFIAQLKRLTDAVAAVPGIDARTLRSLVTPELRQVVVAEGHYYSASIVPADWSLEALTPPQLAQLRANVARADLIGRYLRADRRAAIIEAAFLARDPDSGRPYEQRVLARLLSERVMAVAAQSPFRVEILGEPTLIEAYARALPEAAPPVLAGLGLMLLLTAVLLGSLRLAVITIGCALLTVIWQLGLMKLSGLLLAPEAVLYLWLSFALAQGNALLLATRWLRESAEGDRAGHEASPRSWRAVAAPLAIAQLSTASAAIIVTLYSDIHLLRDLAIGTALGLYAATFVNGLLLPVLLSSVASGRLRRHADAGLARLLRPLGGLTGETAAALALVLVAALIGWSRWQAQQLAIDDPDGDYAQLPAGHALRLAAPRIASEFPYSVDRLVIVVDAARDACTRHDAMTEVDRLAGWLRNVPGVTGTRSLPQTVQQVLTAFSDGSPKFAVLARNRETLTQAVAPISPGAGLHDEACTVLPVEVQMAGRDPAAQAAVIDAVEAFNRRNAEEFFAVHPDVDAAYCASQRRARARGVVPPALSRDCPVHAQPALGSQAQALARRQTLEVLLLPALAMVLALFVGITWLLLADSFATMAILLPVLVTGLALPGLLSLAGVTLTAALAPASLLVLGGGLAINLLLHQEYRQVRGRLLAVGPAWRQALTTAGRGGAIAALIVALGSLPLLAASLPLLRDLGVVMAAATLLNLLLSLLLLPAMLALEPPLPLPAAPTPGLPPNA